MKDSADLAIDHLNKRVGGLETEVIYLDDQVKPDVGVQAAEELLKKHQVDFVAGIIWSNVMMAVVPVVTGAGKTMAGANAGASPLAGSPCHEPHVSACRHNTPTPGAPGTPPRPRGQCANACRTATSTTCTCSRRTTRRAKTGSRA